MKHLLYFILVLSSNLFAQSPIAVTLIQTTDLKDQDFVGIDAYGALYTMSNSVFYKTKAETSIPYSNLQLGTISSAHIFNPLKIILFYKNFNTVVFLDNRLSEINKIDFNALQPYKNISHISTGTNSNLWIFNADTQQLELYDYKRKVTLATTQPIASKVLDLKSNYNYCYLLTENYLYTYSYFGSLISKLNHTHFKSMAESNGQLIVQQDNQLLLRTKDSLEFRAIALPDLVIDQFLLTDESLYIYSAKTLYQFELKIN